MNAELKRSIKFTLFSISAGVIQLGLSWVLEFALGWDHWLSYLLGLVASVLWNFTLNRKFTFQSAANVPRAMLKVGLYYLVFTPLSTLWNYGLETLGLDWVNVLAQLGTMLINFVTEYLFCRFFVYRDSLDTAKRN